MIYFNFNIRNPWSNDQFANIKCWHGSTPIKNKYWEIQIIKCDNVLRCEFEFNIRQDHAGLNLEWKICICFWTTIFLHARLVSVYKFEFLDY